MGDKLSSRILIGVFVISLVATPALHAIGAWATLGDAIWDFEEGQLEAYVGESVSATGDFNGDGYYDVVVGARFYSYDAGSGPVLRSGGAWLFYGSDTGPSATPDLFLAPPFMNAHGYFGEAVATANIDGDDYDDLIISLPNYDNATSDEGAVYVYYGSATGIDGTDDWRVRGASLYAHLGVDVASAGDIDNDGYDDIILGARRYDACNGAMPIINHAYVFMGSATGLGADTTVASADWYAIGDQCVPWDDAAFGMNVGSAGDVNGDGYGDIFVGAPVYDAGQVNEGKLFVWYGSAAGLGATGSPSNADWTAEGNQTEARLGAVSQTSIDSGDFDGDGYDDLIVGSRHYDYLADLDGIAVVWYGSDTGLGDNGTPSNADWLAHGAVAGDQLGANLTVLDYNGDSYDDALIGGLGHQVSGDNAAGMAQIWLGAEDGLSTGGPSNYADWMVEGDQASSYLGWSLSAGDTDGDGYEDMIIGAPYYDLVHADAGKVWTFAGEPTIFIDNFETGDTLRWSITVE
jgi:hypothetical protein